MRDPPKTPFSTPPYSSPQPTPQNQNAAKKLKQVVFIFDATAMMAPFSQIINQTYLAPLFKYLHLFYKLQRLNSCIHTNQ
jgi:hypothetical protein